MARPDAAGILRPSWGLLADRPLQSNGSVVKGCKSDLEKARTLSG